MATNIIVPRRKQEWFQEDGNFTHQAFRFFEELTEVTNSTTTVIDVVGEDAVIGRALSGNPARLFSQQVQIDSANDRIETNTIDLATRPRMSDLVKANQRIDELIDELIVQLENLVIGSDAQKASVNLQVETLKQTKLLNTRFEEMANTGIFENDIEE